MNADTETNVEVARSRAERLIGEGAQLLVGAFDSGQSTAIAQVAEQKGIPLVINIAAAPPITEQGYKFVFRNFPTAPMILGDAFANQKELFEAAGVGAEVGGVHARERHLRHVDAEGHRRGAAASASMPYKIADTIAYDPAARDLSVEVAKAKATGAEALLWSAASTTPCCSRASWSSSAGRRWRVLSMGPGWYEDQYLKTLGKLADGPLSFVPWYDPNKPLTKQLEAALAKAHPDDQPQHQPHLHVRGAADRGRRLQARGLDRPEGARRRHPRHQHHQQRQHRPRHPVRRQGPERHAEERRHPEPRRQARHGGAEGGRQRQGRVADARLRQAG